MTGDCTAFTAHADEMAVRQIASGGLRVNMSANNSVGQSLNGLLRRT